MSYLVVFFMAPDFTGRVPSLQDCHIINQDFREMDWSLLEGVKKVEGQGLTDSGLRYRAHCLGVPEPLQASNTTLTLQHPHSKMPLPEG